MVTLGLAAVKFRLFTVKLASNVVLRFAPPAAVKYTSVMLPGRVVVPVPLALVAQLPVLCQDAPTAPDQ